jgi:DNA-binding XRE family transcriptional regulator
MRRTHEELMRVALSRPGVKQEYEALKEEFALLEELIKARLASGKSQEQIAEDMGTSTSTVGRLETGGGTKRHSPTLATLERYAHAVGCILQIRLVPCKMGNSQVTS